MNISIDNIVSKYQELKTLSNTAKYFSVSVETLRKFFIKHNLPYKTRGKYSYNHNFFFKNNEKSFYWAGFIAADGNISKNRITLCINTQDKDHLFKFKSDISTNSPIKDFIRKEFRSKFKRNEYFASTIKINSKTMVNDLLKFNITPAKSKTLTLNDFTINNSNFRHFIRGLIDGDGWIYRTKNNSEIGLSGTPKVINTVYNFLKKNLNLESSAVKIRKNNLAIWRSTRLKDNIKIIDYLYSNCSIYLNRKKIIVDEILNCRSRKINISKEDLLKSMEKYSTYVDIGKNLNVSNCTIKRRMDEFGLVL